MPQPSNAALAAEITDDPDSVGYSSAVTAADWNAVAGLLNAPTRRGFAPIAEIAAYCVRMGITGGVMALLEVPIGATDSPPTSFSIPTKGMLHTVMTLVQLDYRLELVDVDDPAFGGACDGLITLQAMTAGQKAALLAMADNRQSRSSVLWRSPDEISVTVSGDQCRIAMGAN